MNKMNILTQAQNHTANQPKTSETTPKEIISPAEPTKEQKMGSGQGLISHPSIASAVSPKAKPSEQNKDVKEIQTS